MSVYPPPIQRNGELNTIFNRSDYNHHEPATGGGITESKANSLYLRNRGVVVSSAQTTFDSSIDVQGLATLESATIGVLKTKKASDTLVFKSLSQNQTCNFNDGMVYKFVSPVTISASSISFTNLPPESNSSYIFTFIMQPSISSSPFYIRPSNNTITVNGSSVPLAGLQNVILPASYTYLVVHITIIERITQGGALYSAFTGVSAY